jgi:hypothetical protein
MIRRQKNNAINGLVKPSFKVAFFSSLGYGFAAIETAWCGHAVIMVAAGWWVEIIKTVLRLQGGQRGAFSFAVCP